MEERPQMSRMDSVEVVDSADLQQAEAMAALFSMFIAQQQQRKLERQQEEAYKRAQLIHDTVSGALSLGDVMSDDEFEREMEKLELELKAGEGIKRRHNRGTKRRRRHNRGTKRRRRHNRGTKRRRRHNRGR